MADNDWLRSPCEHTWYLGPVTDVLMRRRPAVCVRCWNTKELPPDEWKRWPVWTENDYLMHKDEVERRFFGG